MTLTTTTLSMMSFSSLTNKAGQNDTQNNDAKYDNAQLIDKQCQDTKNNDTQNDEIQLIDKQGWAK